MARWPLILLLLLAWTTTAYGGGLLIPVEPDVPPLALLNHRVSVALEDQVAVTKIEQTFRNHTDRRLEATYIFPVPEGASVRDLAMWVNGQRVKGELLKADQARQVYTDIVRQTKNPALLDYVGSDLLSLKIFPVPPQADQKVEVSFTAIAKKEHDIVEYVYPLKTDRSAAGTLEEFRLTISINSQQPIGGIYSPTHDVSIHQVNDHQAVIEFEEYGAQLDRDFQLFYTSSGQDIGLTALEHRPSADDDGYVLLLLSPRAELSRDQQVPRDIVFVLDTSGSMVHENKMEQVKQALQHCLDGLTEDDRFGLISFATTVDHYRDQLVTADKQQVRRAKDWVGRLYPGGGTAIHEALTSALEMRTDAEERMFTVVFFTDGQPTIGEMNSERIVADIQAQNTASTRIFSFGVGNDLNAVLLDQLAEKTRAVSRYVKPGEELETRVANFFDKIHHPVLANLSLTTHEGVRLAEVYPPQLPDLFHGDQLVVLARYQGTGHAAVTLDGQVGVHNKQFVYELDFAAQTDDKLFVEELWARRKVGYLLDQIRINGEQQELVDEVVRLAQSYGITTPYTSYLIMPDAPVAGLAAAAGRHAEGAPMAADAPALAGGGYGFRLGATPIQRVEDFARDLQREAGGLSAKRGAYQDAALEEASSASMPRADAKALVQTQQLERLRRHVDEARQLKGTLDLAKFNFDNGQWKQNQVSELGVNLAVCTNELKCTKQVKATAVQTVANRRCMEIGGVWLDEAFTNQTPTISIQAQSDAYFRILERQPQMKQVFRLGNHLLWIAPNGTALVIDSGSGKQQMSDREIDALFQ